MIVGKIEMAEAVGIGADDPVDAIRDAIAGAIKKIGGDGVIIMTDMFGGTPSNMGLSFLEENRVEVLTGVNLPMVINLLRTGAEYGVAELAEKLKKCGRESISVAGDYLKKIRDRSSRRIMLEQEFIIVNKLGLHARASALLVKNAARFQLRDQDRAGRGRGERQEHHGDHDAGRRQGKLHHAEGRGRGRTGGDVRSGGA